LVDDHQLVIDGIKSMLSDDKRYLVKNIATNGQQALDIIKNSPESFDIVITDITMPLMNGIELCKNIKEEFASLQVMVLSMHNSVGIIKEAIAADADGYMLKNIGQDEFLFGLTKLVEDGSYYSHEIAPIIFTNITAVNKIHQLLICHLEKKKF
jgi:DNA-binding NarL/FixJ family response regulator